MAVGASGVSISPVNVLWRIEQSERLDFTGLTGADVDGKYLLINGANDSTEFYVWFNAGAADPAPAGKTAIAVVVLAGDNAASLATKALAAIAAEIEFVGSLDGNSAIIARKAADFGPATNTVDVDSNVVITLCRKGRNDNLGLLDGDVELALSPANFTVLAHQTGVTPRANLFQGLESLEVTTNLLETSKTDLAKIYETYGDTFTPSGGSEVTGIGTAKQGENVLVNAARLVLKPVNAVDDTNNTVVMLASPVPDSLVFSGENPRTLSVTWQGFIDDQIDSRASAFLLGDETQGGLRL